MHRYLLGLAAGLVIGASISWGIASAHVRVFPDEANTRTMACTFAKYTVRVPTEKSIPTVKVRVVMPRGITAFNIQPKPSWRYSIEKSKGRIAAVTWYGGKIGVGEFDEFAFVAGNPRTPMTVAWDAYQTYADGSVVKWTGAPGSDTPHSQTQVMADPAACKAEH